MSRRVSGTSAALAFSGAGFLGNPKFGSHTTADNP
jgi:hypothetical protein